MKQYLFLHSTFFFKNLDYLSDRQICLFKLIINLSKCVYYKLFSKNGLSKHRIKSSVASINNMSHTLRLTCFTCNRYESFATWDMVFTWLPNHSVVTPMMQWSETKLLPWVGHKPLTYRTNFVTSLQSTDTTPLWYRASDFYLAVGFHTCYCYKVLKCLHIIVGHNSVLGITTKIRLVEWRWRITK